ncbi:hypothetical protein Bca4012_041957 [Brassica carinata]
MFVSLRSMGASRSTATPVQVTARDGLRHLLPWVSSSPRGGETTGGELVGLWSEACLSVLGNIMYLGECRGSSQPEVLASHQYVAEPLHPSVGDSWFPAV